MRNILFLLLVVAGLSAAASGQTGKVVGVHDGDTITVLTADKQELKIRFAGVDAPELKQDFGNRSKENLSKLVYGKTVTLEGGKTDKYGRLVRKVIVDGTDANLAQVKAGLAWHYKDYEKEQSEADRAAYAAAEAAARKAKIGLWSMPNPLKPSEYRHGPAVDDSLKGKIVGNRNSHIYHWEGCQGFSKVGEKNRVVFDSATAAEAAGYRAAKGCSTTAPK